MIPNEEMQTTRCEYAHVGDFFITVFVNPDKTLQSYWIRNMKTHSLVNDCPEYLVDGIKLWVKTDYKHSMFLQHYLIGMFENVQG